MNYAKEYTCLFKALNFCFYVVQLNERKRVKIKRGFR